MAKKTTGKKPATKAPAAPTAAKRESPWAHRDTKTAASLQSLADAVVKSALSGREPKFDVPTRAASNTRWNKSRGILQMGPAVSSRELFNLGQARNFMQTLLHGQGIQALIAEGKTSSLRGMFYKAKHTIQGTKEKTFDDQDECDPILEDLEVALEAFARNCTSSPRTAAPWSATSPLSTPATRSTAGAWARADTPSPPSASPRSSSSKKCEADFILHVEKDTVWQRFNEDRFWEKHNCILTHGAGQPPRGCRRLLQRLNQELKLPIICLLDCDPWGHYIYSVIKQGSISLAFESERLAIPEAKFLGIRAKDYQQCGLSDDVQIALNDKDIARARQIKEYPWFADNRAWQREIDKMLANGFKMEVESLITKDISYVTETYVPERLAAEDWLS